MFFTQKSSIIKRLGLTLKLFSDNIHRLYLHLTILIPGEKLKRQQQTLPTGASQLDNFQEEIKQRARERAAQGRKVPHCGILNPDPWIFYNVPGDDDRAWLVSQEYAS